LGNMVQEDEFDSRHHNTHRCGARLSLTKYGPDNSKTEKKSSAGVSAKSDG